VAPTPYLIRGVGINSFLFLKAHLGSQGSENPGFTIALQVAASTPWLASHSFSFVGIEGSSARQQRTHTQSGSAIIME